MNNGLCELHPDAPLVSAGPDAVCLSCVDDVYQREKGGEGGIFARVISSLSEVALSKLSARLEEKARQGTYQYEALLRAIAAHSLSTGLSVDEVLAKIASVKSADFLFHEAFAQ